MGARWAFGEPRPDELDPTVLMWWIRGGIDPDRLLVAGPTGGRSVLHVRVPDARRTRFWFVVTPADVSLCFTDPGFEVDVTLESSLGVLYQVWLGTLELPAAVRDGLVTLAGRREVVRRLPERAAAEPGGALRPEGGGARRSRTLPVTESAGRGDSGRPPRRRCRVGTLRPLIARTSPPSALAAVRGAVAVLAAADTPDPVRPAAPAAPTSLRSPHERPRTAPFPPFRLLAPARTCAATPSWPCTPTPTTRRSSPG